MILKEIIATERRSDHEYDGVDYFWCGIYDSIYNMAVCVKKTRLKTDFKGG